jgi:hypothetical protein
MQQVIQAIKDSGFIVSEVVSGGARGVDRLGEDWAKINKVPVTRFLADWNKYGKRAGYVRNAVMASYGTALVAVWDGCSKGTKHMIDLAAAKGLPVHIRIV